MIDLHTHSTASDGTYSPSELVNYAANKGVTALALTDHDTTNGLLEAQKAAQELGITFVPGIEISIDWPTGEFHLLGLGLQRCSSSLKTIIDNLEEERINRNLKMIQKLNEAGIDISYEELKERFNTKNIGRPHFAALMVEKKLIKNRQLAFNNYFAKGRPCYVERKCAPLSEAVLAIEESGGIPVQAHPLSIYVSWGKMEETMKTIINAGVKGLEAWHPGVRVSEAERLEELSHKLGVIATAGSDFHGEKVRSDRHIGHTAGDKKISDKYWVEELKPALEKIHGGSIKPFTG